MHIEQINGKVEGTPSSFRAELIAIIISLSMVRMYKEVHIGMDSQLVIAAIKGYVNQSIYRKTTHYKCDLVLEFIKEPIQQNHLIVFLYKIESHLNYRWNDQVDQLA